MHIKRVITEFTLLALCGILASCASYHRLPLPVHSNLQSDLRYGGVAYKGKLTLSQVATLAVARDPVLHAARSQVEVARAKSYAAGLLPDPTLGLTGAYLMNGPDSYNGWSTSFGESLIGLLTHGDRQQAARATYAARLLAWRWQAQQVALKAQVSDLRLWAIQIQIGNLTRQLASMHNLLVSARRAENLGAYSRASYALLNSRFLQMQSKLDTLKQRAVTLKGKLKVRLGLRATGKLSLARPRSLQALTAQSINQALKKLPARRLDLRALQAGYESANAHLRAAILSQFPILGISINRGRDTSGNNTIGLSIHLRLPVFNGSRGAIAVARATRRALRSAYQAHLDESISQIHTLSRRLRLVNDLWHSTREQASGFQKAAVAAEAAASSGAISRLAAFTNWSLWLTQRSTIAQLDAQRKALILTLSTLLSVPVKRETYK